MPNDHDIDPQTFRCRHCGRGLLAVQYEACVRRAAAAAKQTVPQRALDFINRGWKPTI